MTKDQDFRLTFLVDNTPEEVFDAISNVRGWWSEDIAGATDKVGEFRYHYRDVHRCTIKITELIPSKKVAWHVVENYFNFIEDTSEWTGTNIVFDIVKESLAKPWSSWHRPILSLSPPSTC